MIRKMTEDDLTRVCALENQIFSDAFTLATVLEHHRSPSRLWNLSSAIIVMNTKVSQC